MDRNKAEKAPYNRTLSLTDKETDLYKRNLLIPSGRVKLSAITNRIINSDIFHAAGLLPDSFIDLLFIDPPYNLHKKFNKTSFREMDSGQYTEWLDSWLSKMTRLLKPNASVYICGDWKSSSSIYSAAVKYFKIQNRITWEREKGRGAKYNWKNCSEDIWFCTMSDDYTFNLDAVKMNRRVLAPYKTSDGNPKDWQPASGSVNLNFRTTHPSNLWTDITVPFWSMPENTEHPTQKPEKLLAKIILASSNPGDFVFDPFLGSGTTAVTAKKLGRNYSGIEIDETYCCYAEKRLDLAETDKSIQGYEEGVFWERNSFTKQKSKKIKQQDYPLFHPVKR
jgi:site-specific DNA-methyltransferase (adenine-specific)